jgi:uncharacterized peroxidase-related enzyme
MNLFTHYNIDTAPEAAKPLLEQIKKSYGFIPSLFNYMAEAPTTIEAYLALNALIAKTSLSPIEAQLALLTTSIENDCDFCKTAHLAFAKKYGAKQQTLKALIDQQKIVCPCDAALILFTQQVVNKRGHLLSEEVDNFLSAGFSKQQIMEVILVVTIKTLSNYINHLTQPEVNPEVLAML